MDDTARKAIGLGAMLLLVNVILGVTGTVDGLIEGAVQDSIEGSMDELSDFDENWTTTKGERVYFAYSITDEAALSSDDPSQAFDYMGPFIYEVTTQREVLDFDSDAGEITYSEFESFEWCENCTWNGTMNGVDGAHASVSGDTEITQVNILWNTQRMAGLATGIEYGETFAKAGFANEVIRFELMNKAPSIWASQDIAAMISASNKSDVLSGWLSAIGASSPDWANDSSYSSVPNSVLTGAVDPSTGACIALNCEIGPLVFAGMGAPSASVTPLRASLYGYAGTGMMATIDAAVYAGAATAFSENGGGVSFENITDWGERLKEVTRSAGCGDGTGYCPKTVDVLQINPEALEYTLFGTNEETGLAAGILATSDFEGIPLHGTALFLLGASANAGAAVIEYGIGFQEFLDLVDYVGRVMAQGHLSFLIGETRDIPNIMFGGSGFINADLWWETSFGGTEPIAGGYLTIGINRGEYEGTVEIPPEKAREILYDSEYALTGDFARVFMYGEFAGVSLPIGPDGAQEGGVESEWNDAYVAGLYGISEIEAAALRSWVKDFMFEQVVGALLTFQYGSTAYTTQSVSNWLYGWSDPVLEGLFGYESSWSSLETNETYYGSDGLGTGDYSVYVMSTKGATIGNALREGYINSNGDGLCDFERAAWDATDSSYKIDAGGNWEKGVVCEENETYALTTSMPWRSDYSESFTYGLLSDHVGNALTETSGTIGGKSSPLVNDPSSSFRLNVVGYAIGESTVVGDETYKDIPMVEHSIVLEPEHHQIQAKLIGSKTFVDVLPGALPVYFSVDSTFMVDKVAGAVMYGDVSAAFHLDLRGPGSTDPDFSEGSIDTHPVFEIKNFGEISDEDAASYRASVSDNMGLMGWTNFGGEAGAPLLYVHIVIALLYAASISMIGYGAYVNQASDLTSRESEENAADDAAEESE